MPLGVIIYLGGAKLFHIDTLESIIELAKGLLSNLMKKKERNDT